MESLDNLIVELSTLISKVIETEDRISKCINEVIKAHGKHTTVKSLEKIMLKSIRSRRLLELSLDCIVQLKQEQGK